MTTFTDKVKLYNSRLKADLNLTDEQAAGIWGNLGAETGGFTALQEKNPTVAGSRGGYGWMQWTGPRRKKYEAWCKTNGLDLASDEANYRYLVYETKTDEAHSLVQLKKTTTVDAAVETFMAQNLRPGVPHLDARKRWGAQAYNVMKNQSQVVQQTATTGAVIVGGGLVATQIEPSFLQDHIFAIGVGLAIVISAIVYFIHKRNEDKKQPVLVEAPIPAKHKTKKRKGKKNGKSQKN